MKVLVDTHALVWWAIDKPSLSSRSRALFVDDNNEILVSAVVAWELATKARSGKWPDALALATHIASVIDDNSLTPLSITVEHARVAGSSFGNIAIHSIACWPRRRRSKGYRWSAPTRCFVHLERR
jgi:PIN domain nuclease of toxin-antitoxin system